MKLKRNILIGFISLTAVITLAACSSADKESLPDKNTDKITEEKAGKASKTEDSHSGMEHSGSGEIPEGLKDAANPTYKVGSKAIMKDDHMPGMEGAEATIVGAYSTTVYALSYDPTIGGDRVENHKWVIHEELQDADDQALNPGDEATINADHMPGMDGAKAVIDTAEETTVYMVDFIPTDGAEKVTNHMWVTEGELSAVE